MAHSLAAWAGLLALALGGCGSGGGGGSSGGGGTLPNASSDGGSDAATGSDTVGTADAVGRADTIAAGDGGATADGAANGDADPDDGAASDGAIADAVATDTAATDGAAGDTAAGDGTTGDGAADGGPTLAPVALKDLAATAAAALCKANFETCAPEDKLPFATAAGCIAAVQAADADTFDDLIALVEAGKLSYDPQQAANCVALAAATCDEIDLVDGPPACQAMFTGKLANGKACKYNVECASHFCPDVDGCGTVCKARVPLGKACGETDKCVSGAVCFGDLCVADVPKNAGADCGAVKCKKGLYCNDLGKCAALNKAGQPCDQSGSCEAGLQCLLNGDAGLCQPLPKQGELCSPDIFSDQSVQCAAGLTCFNDGGESGTCEAKAAIGAPCTNSSNCGGWDVHCVGPKGASTCQLLSGKGGPCKPGDLAMGEWGGCLAPYTCNKGTCTELPKLGEPCADDILAACSPELMCDFFKNVCIPLPALGEKCYGICAPGLECDLNAEGTEGVCIQGNCP